MATLSVDEAARVDQRLQRSPVVGRTSLLTVMLHVALGCLLGVMAGVGVMAVRQVSVMRGLLVRTGLLVLGRFLMMTGGMLVMLGGLLVMLRSLL